MEAQLSSVERTSEEKVKSLSLWGQCVSLAKTKNLTGFVDNFSDMLPILEVMLDGDF